MMESTTQVTRVITRGNLQVRVFRTLTLTVRSSSPSGPEAGLKVAVDRPVYRIGAHASNDLVLTDPTVSQQHLEIHVEPTGYRLVDLDSSNGTWVGAVRIREATCTEAIALEVGHTTLELAPSVDEVEIAASDRTRFGTLVGRSVAMRELYGQLDAAAKSEAGVLIEGETGVGKERVAESLHQESARAGGPFVIVDCGALAGDLLESELFGYVAGAFTGARGDREGLLASANGGTVFFDEIGELPMALQAKLLGVLERKRVQPLGSTTPRPLDVRVIAATHRDLGREVNQGRFRADLFYRIAVLRLRVPPLRERLDDLPLLVEELLAELGTRLGAKVPQRLSALALVRLQSQAWPGNVRELRSAIERALLGLPGVGAAAGAALPAFTEAREAFVADFERRYFEGLLAECKQVVSEAARRAGLERRHFQRLLRRHGITS